MALESDLVVHWMRCVRSGIAVDSSLLLWPVMTVWATSSVHKEHSHHAVLARSYLSRIGGTVPALPVAGRSKTVEVMNRLRAVPDAEGVGRGVLTTAVPSLERAPQLRCGFGPVVFQR